MSERTVIALLFCGFGLLTAGCTSAEKGSPDRAASAAPVIVLNPPAPQTPLVVHALPPGYVVLPGELAIRTTKGYYLTAIDGGGRSTAPIIITSSMSAGSWERFRMAAANPPTDHDKSFVTATGNYLTAVNGGGLTADALHTDATQIQRWEKFRLLDLGVGGFAPTYYAIQTIRGNYLTAVGAGGQYAEAMHTDAGQIKTWEEFRLLRCGDPGSGNQYFIIPANGDILTAVDGGGHDSGDTIVQGIRFGFPPDASWSKFRLIRQDDGSYGIQTSNGVNFVTALQGGGEVQKYLPPNCGFPGACISGFSTIFHTDATQVRAWEKFRIVDNQGDCRYTIQTVSGFFFGLYMDSNGYTLFTTRRTVVTDNEKFQLAIVGLESPVVIH